jgi:hypothetical protein
MIPRSTAKLSPGDYCVVERTDGSAVAFAFLGSVPGKRSYFHGALLSPPFDRESISNLPSKFEVCSRAMVHINCFAENETPIVGNIADRIGVFELEAAYRACTDTGVGAVHSVWGHRTLARRAEDVGV